MPLPLFWLPVSAALALSSAFSQPAPQIGQTGLVLRSTTTLVQVGVAAQDNDGQSVFGLTKNDFEIFDRGRKQPIALFLAEKPSSEATRDLAPNTFTNQFADQETSPQGGYAVVVLDWLNTAFRSSLRARTEVIDMLRQFGPTDKVALYVLDHSGLRIVAEFGSGTAALLHKLASLHAGYFPYAQKDLTLGDDEGSRADAISLFSSDNPDAIDPQWQDVENERFTDQRVKDTLRAFEAVANHLTGMPGRKGLIWVSSGFPTEVQERTAGGALFAGAMHGVKTYSAEIQQSIRKLNAANVALYAVDARGLTMVSGVSATGENMTTQSMDKFASATGGLAYHGLNELAFGMRRALDDVRAGYTLGFYAPADDPAGGVHRLTVRVNKPGVKLRYREGYSIDNESSPVTAEDRKALAIKALLSPVDNTVIPIQAKAERDQTGLKLQIALKPSSLGLARTGGRWRGGIDLIVRFCADNGEEAGAPLLERMDLDLAQGRYEAAERDGFILTRNVPIPAEATRLRVLVQSNSSGNTGTLTIPLRAILQASR